MGLMPCPPVLRIFWWRSKCYRFLSLFVCRCRMCMCRTMKEIIDDGVLERQLLSVRCRNVPLVDREAVVETAEECGYSELVQWVEEVESDHYLLVVESFVQSVESEESKVLFP